MRHDGRVGMEGLDMENFPSYLGVKENVRTTVASSAYTVSFIDCRVNSVIYLFSTDSLRVRKSKHNE
jgi:hypothetical protein